MTQKKLPVAWIIPNLVTIMAMCSGLSAVRFALDGRFEKAFLFIFIACFLDGMDGRLARMLKSSSTFGAQLDSLSDFISFGVAPAMVIYLWDLQSIRGFGWAIALFFVVCCALRLARFNSDIFADNIRKDISDKFFTGIPSPAGSMLAVLPMVISFELGADLEISTWVVSINMIIVGLLMVSKIPTFSVKRVKVSSNVAMLLMLAAAITVTLLMIEPWKTVIFYTVIYYLCIPLAYFSYCKAAKLHFAK